MNYTITLTYSELINIAALLDRHIELCKSVGYDSEASEYQATLDKIRSGYNSHTDAQLPDSIYAPDPEEVPTHD